MIKVEVSKGEFKNLEIRTDQGISEVIADVAIIVSAIHEVIKNEVGEEQAKTYKDFFEKEPEKIFMTPEELVKSCKGTSKKLKDAVDGLAALAALLKCLNDDEDEAEDEDQCLKS